MRLVTASLIAALVASPLLAQEPVQEREHTVRKGDTLWDLAGYYFSNPFRWPMIYQANTSVVEDPHWIYPQEVLVIPGLAGETPMGAQVQVQRPMDRPVRTIFYRRPAQESAQGDRPTVLSEPEMTVFPVRPGEYNSAPYAMDPDDLTVIATFVRSVRQMESPEDHGWSHPQDRVFLNYADRRPEVGQRLALVAVGDDVDGARGGVRAIHPTGVVRIVALAADVIEAQIEAQYGPVVPGQLVVPLQMFPDFQREAAEPVRGGSDLRGRILEFVDEQPIYGRASLAFVDLGRSDGVSEGDIFEAYLPERTVRAEGVGPFPGRAERLPPEPVARLRVVKVTDAYATVKVDDLELPRLQGGLPVHRIRSMR